MADHNLHNLIIYINSELQAISEWFQINKLYLNVDVVLFMSPKTL